MKIIKSTQHNVSTYNYILYLHFMAHKCNKYEYNNNNNDQGSAGESGAS